MRDLYRWLPDRFRWPVFFALMAATLVYSIELGRQGADLKNSVAPHGIVSYELAASPARSDEIRTSWILGSKLETAETQLSWDFGFLLLYPLPFSLLCAQVARRSDWRAARIGNRLSRLALIAAPLDALENIVLLHFLDHGATGSVAVSSLAALFKFGVLLIALGYSGIQGGILLWRNSRHRD